jgi:hypothetical protein
MVCLRRWAWLPVTVWFVACGSRSDLDVDYSDDAGSGGLRGGSAGRAGSGGLAGLAGRQGGAGGAPSWGSGGYWWATGGVWVPYGGYPATGGARPGYGGYPVVTGGVHGYGGYPPVTGGMDAGPPDSGPSDGGIPWDALPLPDGNPVVDCVLCARNYCSTQVDACVGTTACLGGIVCAVLSCQQGQIDCLLGCFGNDVNALTAGINVATCMVNQCGLTCVTAFGGAV